MNNMRRNAVNHSEAFGKADLQELASPEESKVLLSAHS